MLTGTAGNDMFMADLSANASTFQSGDVINGGNGTDTLMVTLVDTPFAVSATTNSVEIMHVRSQNSQAESDGDNNASGYTLTQNGHNKIVTADDNTIDAQNMTGMTQFWSTDSRADLVIEDVRNNSHETTIGFRNADAGDVDYAVFFNSQHITAPAGNTNGSQLFIQLLDLNAMRDGTGSLTNNPYNGVTITVDGTPLRIAGPTAFQTTYADMVTGLNAALDAAGYPNIRAALGDAFSAINSTNGVAYQGTTVVLTNTGPEVIASTGFVTPDGTLPSNTNIHTLVTNTPATTIPSLTQTNILLDNVGRSSMSGDMMIGNMSTGDSGSKGIEQFNVTVDRSSWIKSLNTTNNSLEVVNVVNTGANGNLRIDDNSLTNDYYGLTDVRVLDASTMTGSVTASAVLGQAVTAKFMNLRDTAANPAADNSEIAYRNVVDTQFSYDLGAGNDSLTLDISAANLAAAGTTTREDFVLEVNGGAGNDTIHTRIVNEGSQTLAANNASNWYANHQINANITVNAGDGNDTIRTEGAGDFRINAGAGNDTIYSDNAGMQMRTIDTGTAAVAQRTVLTVNVQGAALNGSETFSVAINGTVYSANNLAALATAIQGNAAVDTAQVVGNSIVMTGAINAGTASTFTVSDFIFVDNTVTTTAQSQVYTFDLSGATSSAGGGQTLSIGGVTIYTEGVNGTGDGTNAALLASLPSVVTINNVSYTINVSNSAAVTFTAAAGVTAANGITSMLAAGNSLPAPVANNAYQAGVAASTVSANDNVVSNSVVTTATAANAVVAGTEVATFNNGKATWVMNAVNADIANLQSQAAATYNAVNAQLQVTFKTFESQVVTIANSMNSLTNVAITDLHINQAIKDAINTNDVLNKLLVAEDGPGRTLLIKSLIDGQVAATDLTVTFSNTALSTQQAAVVPALELFNSNTGTAALFDGYTGNVAIGTAANLGAFAQDNVTNVVGANSTFESNNIINAGTGNDTIVLGTGAASNDTVVFDATFGSDVIVNFTAQNPGTSLTNADVLNFAGNGGTAWGAISNDTAALDADITAGAVAIVTVAGLDGATAAAGDINWANISSLTLAQVNEAFNSTTAAGATATQSYLLMVQRVADGAATTEDDTFAVFELTSTTATADFTAVSYMGTVEIVGTTAALLSANNANIV